MTIEQSPIPEFEQEAEKTRKMLAAVPEEKFGWKPHEKSMTLGRLASHVAEMAQWCFMTLDRDVLEIQPDWRPFSATTSEELVSTFDSHVKQGREAIAKADPAALNQTWSLVFGGKTVMSMPRAAVLRNVVMNHMIHHRGQLSVYLRLLDVPVPGMFGPSADEPRGF